MQLALNLKTEYSYSPNDFIVSNCNKAAYVYIAKWPQWTSHCCIVYGEPQSGKTHLSKVWQQTVLVQPGDDIHEICAKHKAIIVRTDLQDEEWLFHLYNTAREQGTSILLLLTNNVATYDIALPDLKSRLLSCPQFKLDLPDDQMVRMLIMKHFVDCNLAANDKHIEYIAKRVTRNYGEIRELAYGLATYLAENKRRISIISIGEYMTSKQKEKHN